MNRRSLIYILASTATLIAVMVSAWSCTISYSLSGASISPLAQTVSIDYFPNNAAMVAPTLSSVLTDAIKDRFDRQTRLSQVREGGDLHLEGEIVNYNTSIASVSGDEYATMNRLTIAVRVRYMNAIEPEFNFERTFSAYQDYSVNEDFFSIEGSLIEEIVDLLVEDIFNAAVSNW